MKILHCLLTQLSSSDTITWLRTGCHRPRERSLRFTLGKKGQVSSFMPECKPSFRGPGGTHQGRGEIRVGSQHDQYSLPHRGQPGQSPWRAFDVCVQWHRKGMSSLLLSSFQQGLGLEDGFFLSVLKKQETKRRRKTQDILPNPLSSQSNKPWLNRKQYQIYHANWPFCMNWVPSFSP